MKKYSKFIQIATEEGKWMWALDEKGNVWYRSAGYFNGHDKLWKLSCMDREKPEKMEKDD